MSSSATPAPRSSSGDGHDTTPEDADHGAAHKAGAFDIRTFIGLLIGIYGLVLTVYGLIGSSDAQLAKSDGVNINLWAGIGMVVVAVGFLVWARVRPVIVPDEVGDSQPDGH